MPFRFPLGLAACLMLATMLPLQGCAPSSPPLIQTQVQRVLPPPELTADIPPPDLPDQITTRDQLDQITLDLAGWGVALRSRLKGLRDWALSSAP